MADLINSKYNWEVHSLHPGWVDTPGLQKSLPFFWKWTRKRLRSAQQGADTAVWLSAYPESLPCHFWFDRSPRSPYLLGHRPTKQHTEDVWKQVCTWANISTTPLWKLRGIIGLRFKCAVARIAKVT